MTLPEVYRLFEYWESWPPEHEHAALFARCYTGWTPDPKAPPSQEQSLEERWKAGAMNAADLLRFCQKTGGVVPGLAPGPR